MNDLLLLGSGLRRKGDGGVHGLDPFAAAALHTGAAPSQNPKHWPCEDSLALHRLGDQEYLLVVADAHWGGAAGEVVAREARRAFEGSAGPPQQRLRRALSRIEAAALNSPDESETTALLAHLQGRELSYVSVGDSLLFAITTLTCALVNPLGPAFLGQRPLATHPGEPIHGGGLTLEPGTVVLLASDGLEPSMSGIDPADLITDLIGPAPMEARLAALLARANDVARGGGKDNLALIAVQPA